MRIQLTPEESILFQEYGIRNFADLRQVFLETGDMRLANVYNRSISALSLIAG